MQAIISKPQFSTKMTNFHVGNHVTQNIRQSTCKIKFKNINDLSQTVNDNVIKSFKIKF